jgi:hypothetical protein
MEQSREFKDRPHTQRSKASLQSNREMMVVMASFMNLTGSQSSR